MLLQGASVEVQPERIWAEDQDVGIGAQVSYALATGR